MYQLERAANGWILKQGDVSSVFKTAYELAEYLEPVATDVEQDDAPDPAGPEIPEGMVPWKPTEKVKRPYPDGVAVSRVLFVDGVIGAGRPWNDSWWAHTCQILDEHIIAYEPVKVRGVEIPQDGTWFPHDGGDCPGPVSAVMVASGKWTQTAGKNGFYWHWNDDRNDIIAYQKLEK